MQRRPSRPTPSRRVDDLPWTRGEHREFEQHLNVELHGIRQELVRTRIQLTLVLGGVAVIAFLVPLIITVSLFMAGSVQVGN